MTATGTVAALEYCYDHGWTDGLPVVPCTQPQLDEVLELVDRQPDEVLLEMPQLNRAVTVRLAAINAVMAGCRPEYFPVVLAAWDSLREEGYARKGIWQSTTGTGSLLLVNGPVRARLGVNSRGNVFGPGFRANATIGRAIRLTALNALGLRPHELDQATQGTPAKYTCCIGENEEESPWPPLHVDLGLAATDSAVTAMTMRSTVHIEARHTAVPEQLLRDISGTAARTGALLHQSVGVCLALSPEHAHLLAGAGWSKRDIAAFLYEDSFHARADLDRVGKGAISRTSRWRVPADHPDAVLDPGPDPARDGVHALTSPDAILVIVAGAANSGVSAVIETFGPRGGRPPVTRIHEADRDVVARDVVARDVVARDTAGRNAALDAVLHDVAQTLQRDGFSTAWDADGAGRVSFRVSAGTADCLDCLVPRPVMESIIGDAMTGTRFTLAELTLPGEDR